MTDIVLKDIDPVLADRIRRAAAARAWDMHETLLYLLELGLFTSEGEVRTGFNDREVNVLSDAITALRDVPAGPGFGNEPCAIALSGPPANSHET